MTNAEARFNEIHIRKVYACLAVTCHLHFWQNDRDFLRATVVTRGWNGYRNKSQHRKSTLEKKILPPFQQGFEPATFQSRVRRCNHWAIPALSCCVGFHIAVFMRGISPRGLSELRWLDERSLASCVWARFPDDFQTPFCTMTSHLRFVKLQNPVRTHFDN